MSDALLRAILIDPADDLPRLIYSDWLEEHGQAERAQFIRWGCERPQNSSVCLCVHGRGERPCETCQILGAEIAGIPRRSNGETPYVATRGFVSEVRVTLAAFTGGPCVRRFEFGGRRVIENPRPRRGSSAIVICPNCQGTGQVSGHAEALFRSHPIERVVLTDRRPADIGDERSETTRYGWYCAGDPQVSADDRRLPTDIYLRLAGGVQCRWMPHTYDSPELASAACSAACVAYGRSLVGLPPRTVRGRFASA